MDAVESQVHKPVASVERCRAAAGTAADAGERGQDIVKNSCGYLNALPCAWHATPRTDRGSAGVPRAN